MTANDHETIKIHDGLSLHDPKQRPLPREDREPRTTTGKDRP